MRFLINIKPESDIPDDADDSSATEAGDSSTSPKQKLSDSILEWLRGTAESKKKTVEKNRRDLKEIVDHIDKDLLPVAKKFDNKEFISEEEDELLGDAVEDGFDESCPFNNEESTSDNMKRLLE